MRTQLEPRARFVLAVGVAMFGAACTSTSGTQSHAESASASPSSAEATISPVVTASVDLDQASTSIAIGEGAVWVRTTANTVIRLDPETAAVVSTVDVPG